MVKNMLYMICYINTTSTSAGFCVSTVAHSHNTRDTIFRSLFFSVSSAQSCKQFFALLILVRFDIARLCRFDVSFSWKQSPRRAPPERTAHVSLHQTSGWKEMRTEVKLSIQKFTDFKEWNVTTFGSSNLEISFWCAWHRAYSGSLEKSPLFSRSDSQGFQTASRMLHSAPDSRAILRAVRYSKESFCFTCVPLGRCGFNMVTSRLRRGFHWEQFYQYAMILSGVGV